LLKSKVLFRARFNSCSIRGIRVSLDSTLEKLFDIIYEDDDLLVINKPAGLVCHPTKTDEYSSLIGRVRLHLRGKTPAHMIHRLDRETSGVVIVAKSSAVAGELGKIIESRTVQKEYLAIVHGHVNPLHQNINASLGKDESSEVAVKDCVRADGSPAQTEIFVERLFENDKGKFSLLRVVPLTGRKHQIRIHLQFIAHPIVGDKLYGHDPDCYLALAQNRLTPDHWQKLILPHQALHASEVRFTFRGSEKVFRAAPEDWFKQFAQIGG
jgi:23S rRNA pseudouridine1911/1915/1917 synthase